MAVNIEQEQVSIQGRAIDLGFGPDAYLIASNALEFIVIYIAFRANNGVYRVSVVDRGGFDEAVVCIGAGWLGCGRDRKIINVPTAIIVEGIVQRDEVETDPYGVTGVGFQGERRAAQPEVGRIVRELI